MPKSPIIMITIILIIIIIKQLKRESQRIPKNPGLIYCNPRDYLSGSAFVIVNATFNTITAKNQKKNKE